MYLIFNGQRTIYLKGTTNGNKITRVTQVTLKKKLKASTPAPWVVNVIIKIVNFMDTFAMHLVSPAKQWKYRKKIKILYLLAKDFITMHLFFSQIHMRVKKKIEYFPNIWPYWPHPKAVTLYNEQWYKLTKDLQNTKRKFSAV